MTIVISQLVEASSILLPSTNFLPGAKIFPVSPLTKRPALIGWQAAATSDPAQHAAWAAQFTGCGWGIACAESGWIGVEIDPKARKVAKDNNSEPVGPERAEQAWRDLWGSHGANAPWPPHTRSPSGGSHFYFLPPSGVDVKSLTQGGLVKLPGWQQNVIETRINGLFVIPPSVFNGRAYTQPEGGPSEPYQMPPWLLEMIMRKVDTKPASTRSDTKPGDAPAAIVKKGSYNLRHLAKYVCKVHHRVGLPRDVWLATIYSLVAQYGRYVAWQIAQAIHDGEPDTSDQIDDLVMRARETFQVGDSTLSTLFKHAGENGIRDVVPESISFGFAAEPLDIVQILKEIDMEELKAVEAAPPLVPSLPASAVSMTGGQPIPLPEHGNLTAPQAFALEDFVAYLPGGTFCYLPTREMWPATGVNAKVGDVMVNGVSKIKAATWLSHHQKADAMAWSPGEPTRINDRLLVEGGWIEKIGDTTLNTYRPATIVPREGDASPWFNHGLTIYPDDWQHIVNWLAHRLQRPGEKLNHALVLGGEPGVGKDTLLEPIKPAVGAWNFYDVSPANIMGRFNSHLKSIVLRISEVHDLGDIDRFAFYDKTKTLCAAPPDTHRIDEKNMREYQAVNVCGVIMTTNHKAGGLYLPPDDRRHYVAWSPTPTGFFTPEYFDVLYRWFQEGGNEIVAHYLTTLDISAFNPKATPPKTPAFWEIVQSARAPESADVADALDALGRPDAVTLAMLEHSPGATPDFRVWLGDRKNGVKIGHRMTDAGYEPVRNPDANDGLWRIGGRRRAVYGRRTLGKPDQIALANVMVRGPAFPPPSPTVQLPPPPMLQIGPPPY
jgi:hypothetical protein